MEYDVAIVGGGPAGSTCASLVRKYHPNLRVVILERARFPRDHVGESQLPAISRVLDEMGCWDKVEAAGFPIKVGATYRWGQTDDLWDFEFLNDGNLRPEPRPAKYEGQRRQTAFQVDRAIYDKILLDHARELGAEVREETPVRQVHREDDRIQKLVLDDGTEVLARHYVDASGHVGVIRRAMGVEVEQPTSLQNIAIWDYWQNADWAVNIGVGGTRVQVLSQSTGWVWFIPLGPTRTSIGLIVPAEHYRNSGKRPADLYAEALAHDPVLRLLMKNATPEGNLSTTKDWSFLASRLAGENWFLAGESAGFADPILAAGMTLAHFGAREVAYTILALEEGTQDATWLRSRYDESHRQQIMQHIRFADFWYTSNGLFGDLKAYTSELAKDAGLEMNPEDAWRWFGQGGFIDHNVAGAGFAGYSLGATKAIAKQFSHAKTHYEIAGKTTFVLDLEGAAPRWGAQLNDGRIVRHRCFYREGKYLPQIAMMGWLIEGLKQPRTFRQIATAMGQMAVQNRWGEAQIQQLRIDLMDCLETMVSDGWVKASVTAGEIAVPEDPIDVSRTLHENRDISMKVQAVEV
ncbi:MAG: NAD(P)/FAD-dependent oxidoreductase [Fimbriimonas sp.]